MSKTLADHEAENAANRLRNEALSRDNSVAAQLKEVHQGMLDLYDDLLSGNWPDRRKLHAQIMQVQAVRELIQAPSELPHAQPDALASANSHASTSTNKEEIAVKEEPVKRLKRRW